MRERLLGGDLRSIAQADEVAAGIKTQRQFDVLFSLLHEGKRLLRMRSIDAIEKVTRRSPRFLAPHKDEILAFSRRAANPEFKWHLALLLSRLALTGRELDEVIDLLTRWALDKSESRIVRVNAIQSLHDLSERNPIYKVDFLAVIDEVGKEQVPSLNARIRKLRVGRVDDHDERG
ncbi:hypothetical protein [Bifidobacterium favimelis]